MKAEGAAQAAKDAVERLAKGGYQHVDLSWRHVGFAWDKQRT